MDKDVKNIVAELKSHLIEDILRKWYPLVIDKSCGGYFTNLAYDWTILPEQEKMIVTQARHVWTLSKAAEFVVDGQNYNEMAMHGFSFLKDRMWDKDYGGFYQIRNREGGFAEVNGWRDEKRTYGNAFGIFGLSALYKNTKRADVLELAYDTFLWLEKHAYDQKFGGYFQFLSREGKPFDKNSIYKTTAVDSKEVGFKDQNSSIHLMEAYTELYKVFRDPVLYEKLRSLLVIIRDKMVTKEGYLQLFFYPDWTPVSFRGSSREQVFENFDLDHVSFGHDYETAFLMLEASYWLGINDDYRTLIIAKKMLDHALRYGWDDDVGGFYDAGFYFKGNDYCTIIKDTKTWWAQAEALNALLLFAKIFTEEKRYYDFFLRQWDYIKNFVIDKQYGDWFEGGIDKEPHFKTAPKSHMWKCTYHTVRALINCIEMLIEDPNLEINKLIDHWRNVAESLSSKKVEQMSNIIQ